jgi:putative copper resistance protein D
LTDLLILVRFAHFASAMTLFGASVFAAALAPPTLRDALAISVARILTVATAVSVVTMTLWLMLEGAAMTGVASDAVDPMVLGAVLTDTAFGRVWEVRLVLGLALIVSTLWRKARSPAPVAILATLSLASLGFVGHAGMRQGMAGLAERLNQSLHLLAGGFWLGALAPLALSLSLIRAPGLKGAAALALRRFSGLGHGAVALVLATGIVNVVAILGRWPFDFSSPYQTCLDIKIFLVAAMVAIALYNRYRLTPSVGRAPEEALRGIARNTFVEMALGAAVLALVSAFATFAPV